MFMKKLLLFMLLFSAAAFCISQDGKLNIIVIGAHPDDCDVIAGGTAILYSKLGHNVKFISMTNGDAGHQSMGGGALAKRRMAEAQEAGKRFGVEYLVMDNHAEAFRYTPYGRKPSEEETRKLFPIIK